MYPYDHRPAPANPDVRLVTDIAKAIDGQYGAIICYERLAKLAPNEVQETVDSYHEIADRSRTHAVREPFRRAAFDEQNHAVWFLYFLTLNR